MRDFVIRPKDQEIIHAPIEIHQSYFKKKIETVNVSLFFLALILVYGNYSLTCIMPDRRGIWCSISPIVSGSGTDLSEIAEQHVYGENAQRFTTGVEISTFSLRFLFWPLAVTRYSHKFSPRKNPVFVKRTAGLKELGRDSSLQPTHFFKDE